MKRAILAWLLVVSGAPLAAQWLSHPTPGIPRLPDGKPNLTAPAPRTADGKPDISGTWSVDGTGYAFDILADHGPEMLPWAQAVYKQRLDDYAKDDTDVRCLPPGPRGGLFIDDLLKIVQTPFLTLILNERAPTRQIFTDGRELPQDPQPTWMGYSVGRWEGETFVVTSGGFNDKTSLDFSGHPHSEALKVTERFTRLDFGRMKLQMTFEDPKTYTKSWTISVDVNYVADTELLEYVCNENEKDRSRLVGNVADERKREVRVPPQTLAKYVGTYRMPPFGDFRVTVSQGMLMLELPGGGGPQESFAQSDTTFVVPSLGGLIEFVSDSRGAVTHAIIRIVEGDLRADRVANAPAR
jgi:hypothetical protein